MKAKGETNGADKQEINASTSAEFGVYNRWEKIFTEPERFVSRLRTNSLFSCPR